jgi:hypothetical protein
MHCGIDNIRKISTPVLGIFSVHFFSYICTGVHYFVPGPVHYFVHYFCLYRRGAVDAFCLLVCLYLVYYFLFIEGYIILYRGTLFLGH